jgi:hypothetical protein
MNTPEQTTTPYNIPEFNYTLPDAPTYDPNAFRSGQPTYGQTQNYAAGSPQQNVTEYYRNYLGRDPESDRVVQDWASNPNFASGIQNSQEAQTLGRARNEINPLIDSQLQEIYANLGIEKQRSQSQLEALQQSYGSQFGALGFGKQQQNDALDSLRSQIMQDTDYNASQLQGRFLPAQQNAFNVANRRGLLNSSVGLGLLNEGFKPIQTGLTDLFRSSQRQLSDAEQKRQSILQKYSFDYQDLAGKQAQEAKSLQDQLALLISQGQQQATSVNAQRAPSIYARGGELGDANKQYSLQLQALQEQMRFQQEQNKLSRDTFEFGKTKA